MSNSRLKGLLIWERNDIMYFRIEGYFMEEKKVIIETGDGSSVEAKLVTFLMSEDQQKHYVVYTFGEEGPDEGDEIIYISRIARNGDTLYVEEITDDSEWAEVQTLLKKIANA